MSENIQNKQDTNLNPITPPPAATFFDEREQRRQERRERRAEWRAARHGRGAWIGGVILVCIGIFLLLQNMGMIFLHNWWALFILIPALGSFGSAYTLYRNSGDRLTYAARGALISGLFFSFLAATLLFNLEFGLFWPVLLIMAGAALLLNFILPA